MDLSPNGKCASYFALVMRWLHFFLPEVTYYCMLPGMRKFAAFPSANYLAHRNIVINKNKNTLCKLPGMVSGFAMPKIWRQIAMDISVTAVKPGAAVI
ncbi:hypothetical protein IE985_08575 [Klebsiella pneumoniae]|nr:hypothetical protein [Klebsiella pneumoniae]